MQDLLDFRNGIYAFDAGYVRPLLAAIHMVVEQGRVALVDTGSNDSLPKVLDALGALGLGPEAVDYIFLTHIHLDHAGGAGLMMAHFPNAKLVVHPRGVRHMMDPSQLLAGVRAVYGDDETARLYGELRPIPAERIIQATDGLEVDLAGRRLLCLDAPGHAKHHIIIVDEQSKGIFTGDLFGLSYREMDTDGRQFIFPTTSPVQFDPQAMHTSIDRLLTYQPEAVYLTHFSRVDRVEAQAGVLHRLIDDSVTIALQADQAHPGDAPARHAAIKHALTQLLLLEAERFGCTLPQDKLMEVWGLDIEVSSQGLGVWADQQKAA